MKKFFQLSTFLLLTTCAAAPITAQVVDESFTTPSYRVTVTHNPSVDVEVRVKVVNYPSGAGITNFVVTTAYGDIYFSYNSTPNPEADPIVVESWPGQLLVDQEEAIVEETDSVEFNFVLNTLF